ncbi:MAG: HAMP domain-containing histidine kinase [Treponema sp.]|jgi:two-component system sensor histidine kinase HydH|nr:HAMP domain-containing histidine kinase [Treponema sp.]
MKSVNLPGRNSLLAALFCWLLFSLLAVFIIFSLRDRARLVRDNENERILNALFTGLRDYDDFGSAIEENAVLRERIAGFAVYSSGYEMLEKWGKAPPVFDPSLLENSPVRRFNRYTIPDRRSGSVKFVIHNERPKDAPGEPGPEHRRHRGPSGGNRESRFNVLREGSYVYIDIQHPSYWRTITITGFIYPLSVLALLAFVLYIRRLYLHNVEYRERIEAQQSLVVLGTAASTLAHEIKNPLHSIKIQTGILKKIIPPRAGDETGAEEIARIEEEVERLTNLTYRVNDYLRDAAGNPGPLELRALIDETARRLLGSPIVRASGPCPVLMDGDRARSVFENILRNALEAESAVPKKAGGETAEGGAPTIEALIRREGNFYIITVNDRGRGIAPGDLEKVFDPFFTSKSAGTGIGLAISRRFVEAAGGSIAIANRPGGGVSVKVKLPCAS